MMIEQTTLSFELADPSVSTLVDMVRTILTRGAWVTPWEICDEIYRTRGIRVSDSTSSARIRDLRKAEYGGHRIAIRRRQGTKSYEYKMEL